MRRFADRVKETSTTTGTGPYNLAGAATGFRTFVSGVGSGFRCYYCAENGSDWEVGVGTVTSGSPDTLARTEVLKSSNGDAAVNWGAGTKNLFLTIPAKRVGLQTNFVDGLGLLWVSSTQVKVKAGTCRDGGDLEELTLASDTTLSIATLGAINGTDEFTSARTATTDGTTTVVASGSVTSELLPKTHASITFSTSTTTLTASADVRGYLMVGDLVGNTTTYG